MKKMTISGHIRKSRYLFTRKMKKQMAVYTQKEIPRIRDTRKAYSILLGRTRPHNTHTPKPKEKKKGTSLLSRPDRPARSGRIAAKWRTFCCRARSVVVSTHSLLSPLSSRTTFSVPSPLQQLRTTTNNNHSRSSHTHAFPFHSAPPPFSSPAPFGRAFAPSANRDNRHALHSSTSQGGRSHRSNSRTLSAFKQAAFS